MYIHLYYIYCIHIFNIYNTVYIKYRNVQALYIPTAHENTLFCRNVNAYPWQALLFDKHYLFDFDLQTVARSKNQLH